jgi:hypothetical protein
MLHVLQFSLVQADDLEIWSSSRKSVGTMKKSDIFQDLMQSFAKVPKKEEKTDVGDYAIINVSPSVIPNPFLPSFRIFTYNVTRGGQDAQRERDREQRPLTGVMASKSRHQACRKGEWRQTWACQLDEAWQSDPRAPSRTNTLWTPLGYAQVSDLIHSDHTRSMLRVAVFCCCSCCFSILSLRRSCGRRASQRLSSSTSPMPLIGCTRPMVRERRGSSTLCRWSTCLRDCVMEPRHGRLGGSMRRTGLTI